MINITYVNHDGQRTSVSANAGTTLMEVAKFHDVPGILADCGGACACATCHINVDSDWLGKLPEVSETEDSMLEFAVEDRSDNSRLACQIPLTAELDGIVVHVPEEEF